MELVGGRLLGDWGSVLTSPESITRTVNFKNSVNLKRYSLHTKQQILLVVGLPADNGHLYRIIGEDL